MNTPQNQPALPRLGPDTAHLSETYLQLEGFTNAPLTTHTEAADLAHIVTDAVASTDSLSDHPWQEAFVTFGVIFTVLVTSSMVLGFGASKITEGLQQASHHVNRQALGEVGTPTGWRF